MVALVPAHREISHCARQILSVLQSIPLELFLSSLHTVEHAVLVKAMLQTCSASLLGYIHSTAFGSLPSLPHLFFLSRSIQMQLKKEGL